MAKAYITIKSPSSLNTKIVHNKIKKYLLSGVKTYEIGIVMEFVTSEKVLKQIADKFQVLKNRISFELKNK